VRTHWRFLIVAITALMYAGRAGFADSLNIIVTETGTGYFQIDNAADAQNGIWTSFGASSSNWDSMIIKPGTADNGSTSSPNFVGMTDYFAISSITNVNTSFSYIPSSVWRVAPGNTSGSTEAGLILTSGGSGATASVSNLLILDGAGGIFVYNAPTTLNPTNLTSPIATYGYTGNGTTSYDPGGGTPINELGGLTGGGVESDLEYNGGFAGSGNGTNIGVGGEEVFTAPNDGKNYLGYVYQSDTIGSGDPNELRETTSSGGFLGYVSPTIYFELSPTVSSPAAPLPASFWSGLSLMGILVALKFRASRRMLA
jgi:hypothetical protein